MDKLKKRRVIYWARLSLVLTLLLSGVYFLFVIFNFMIYSMGLMTIAMDKVVIDMSSEFQVVVLGFIVYISVKLMSVIFRMMLNLMRMPIMKTKEDGK